MKNQFNVLIIGAGQIGAFFDTPKTSNILTHAHAFTNHKNFILCGFYDTDYSKSQKAAKLWSTKCFKNLRGAFLTNKIDVVCVAVPDKFHHKVLKSIVKYHPKLVFSEKPITTSLRSAQEIVDIYKKNHVQLLINYSRRFVPEIINIKEKINNNDFGKFLGGIGYYGKGTMHNGSHLIDLIRFIVGDFKKVKTITVEKDYSPEDPSTTAIIYLENGGTIFLRNINHKLYSIFEADLLFEKGRVKFADSGNKIVTYKVKENKIYKGYYNLAEEKTIKTSLNKALYYSANHIYKIITKKTASLSPSNNALKDLEVCYRLIDANK